ncbi:MAG: restriction endonuclease subunit S [Candidatus Nanopelagicales bacterium]
MTARLRFLAEVNPATPEFDRLSDLDEVTFMPLETVWADARLDTSRTRPRGEVAGGYVRFRDGDVLCPKVTPTFQAGRTALVRELCNGLGAATTEVHVIRARTGLADPRFVRYLLLTKAFLEEGVSRFQGVAGLQRVPDDYLRDLRVESLGLEQQRRVADFLDDQTTRIDHIIAARQQQAALLGEFGLELQRELTTVGRSARRRSTGVVWMPEAAESWPLLRVAQLFSTGSGTTPSTTEPAYFGGSIPWVNTGDLSDGPVVTVAKAVTDQALRHYPTLRVYEPGSLVIAMYGQGSTKGRVGILGVGACVNQACCVLSPSEAMLTAWAASWFRAHKVHIVELAMGSGQPNLSQEIIRSLRIPAPPLLVQREILAVMSQELLDLRSAALRLADSVALLQELKRSLISAAVSGEFDVSAASGRMVPA